jgi:RES domain-containing protein
MSESAASALLEHLAYLEVLPSQRPLSFPLLRIEHPEGLSHRTVAPIDLGDNFALTRSIGDEWLARQEQLFLVVPSVFCSETWNWIMNPLHPDASQVRIVESLTPTLDLRLVRKI